MTIHRRPEKAPEDATLSQLCSFVIGMKYPFEDLADFIEDRAYEACDRGGIDKTVHQLQRVARFFEGLEAKNDENCRDLADVYILIGEIHQCHGKFAESVEWFRNAAIVNDRYAVPFHALAISFTRMNDYVNAAKSLEQEIVLSPGNYYSYLLLAELYDSQGQGEKSEATINRLLERDPNNVQALHRIITHYEKDHPELDVELLRRRLISVKRALNKVELAIWTHHMCRLNRHELALRYLETREGESPDISIVYLLKAHIYGEMRQFTRKRTELARFKDKNDGNESFMEGKLREFENVFGPKATERLSKRLIISHRHLAGTTDDSPQGATG